MVYKLSSKQEKDQRWQKIKPNYAWHNDIDYRLHPEKYRVGKGEQGVLICQPYKSEILPFWRFKTPDIAEESSAKIYRLFEEYLEKADFVGADMARKFLQMGYTRARRYANHRTGRKYDKVTGKELPRDIPNPLKEKSALIFYEKWKEAENNEHYQKLKNEWKREIG